jgi:hypothetical protein
MLPAVPPTFALLIALTSSDPIAMLPANLEDSLLYVDVTLNGRGPFPFLVSTAVSSAMIDRSVVEELRIPITEQKEAGGATRIATIDYVVIDEVRLAPNVVLTGLCAAVQPLGPQADARRRLSGIIGARLLDDYEVTLDYPRKRIELREKGSVALPVGAPGRTFWVVSEEPTPRGPMIAVTLNGTMPHLLAIDSALDEACVLGPEAARQLGLARGDMFASAMPIFGNDAAMVYGRLDRLELGDLVLHDVPVRFPVEPDVLRSDMNFHLVGILGGPALRPFRVTFDRAHGRVIFERSSPGPPPPFSRTTSTPGLEVAIDAQGLVRVTGVFPGSPAAEAGIALGFVLHEIDGHPTEQADLNHVRGWLRGAPGTMVSLEMSAGGGADRRRVRLARFDAGRVR